LKNRVPGKTKNLLSDENKGQGGHVDLGLGGPNSLDAGVPTANGGTMPFSQMQYSNEALADAYFSVAKKNLQRDGSRRVHPLIETWQSTPVNSPMTIIKRSYLLNTFSVSDFLGGMFNVMGISFLIANIAFASYGEANVTIDAGFWAVFIFTFGICYAMLSLLHSPFRFCVIDPASTYRKDEQGNDFADANGKKDYDAEKFYSDSYCNEESMCHCQEVQIKLNELKYTEPVCRSKPHKVKTSLNRIVAVLSFLAGVVLIVLYSKGSAPFNKVAKGVDMWTAITSGTGMASVVHWLLGF